MKIINNIKQGIKTTIVGSILITASIAYSFFAKDIDKYIFFGTLISGISLLFSPDMYISGLNKIMIIFSKKIKETKGEDETD